MAAVFVAAVWRGICMPNPMIWASMSRPASPLSASTELSGASRPVSTAMVSRSRQTSRSPSFGSARYQSRRVAP